MTEWPMVADGVFARWPARGRRGGSLYLAPFMGTPDFSTSPYSRYKGTKKADLVRSQSGLIAGLEGLSRFAQTLGQRFRSYDRRMFAPAQYPALGLLKAV